MIREATKDDVENISILWEMMVNEMRPELTPNKNWWASMCKSFLAQETTGYKIVVAQKEDEIIGFVDGFIFPEPSTGKIHGVGQHFFILPEYRKGSAAAGLYKTIVSIAIKKGAEVLEFFCFPEGMKFWGKRGYKLTRCMMRREINV